ncbi:MAG: hypothetical protein J2P58_10375 [Acidimicrobiaceae bacterium]|nr:hypothetical protein [Acidimicrobiaceae bacterium]
MQYLELRRQVGGLLANLGPTSGAVAMQLRDSGVRGIPKDVHRCAIARYLNAILGTEAQIHSIRVEKNSVQVLAGRPRIPVFIALPESVRVFVRAFDQRLYPELILNTPESPSQYTTSG